MLEYPLQPGRRLSLGPALFAGLSEFLRYVVFIGRNLCGVSHSFDIFACGAPALPGEREIIQSAANSTNSTLLFVQLVELAAFLFLNP
jgi:hypothetical protein